MVVFVVVVFNVVVYAVVASPWSAIYINLPIAARRLGSACLAAHMSKISTELILGCFYGQNRLAKIPGHGPA